MYSGAKRAGSARSEEWNGGRVVVESNIQEKEKRKSMKRGPDRIRPDCSESVERQPGNLLHLPEEEIR